MDINKLEQENKILKESLRFYANRSNWENNTVQTVFGKVNDISTIEKDKGFLARRILEDMADGLL